MGDRDRRMGARSSAGARGLSGRGADGSGATGRRTHLALRGPFVWTGLAGGTVTESVSHDANTWDGGTCIHARILYNTCEGLHPRASRAIMYIRTAEVTLMDALTL